MAYYRLYSFDRTNKHIIDVLHFNADCDDSAIVKVKPDNLGISRELWNLGRKVTDFAPRIFPTVLGEPSNRFDDVIKTGGIWKWNPLDGPCQMVAAAPASNR